MYSFHERPLFLYLIEESTRSKVWDVYACQNFSSYSSVYNEEEIRKIKIISTEIHLVGDISFSHCKVEIKICIHS